MTKLRALVIWVILTVACATSTTGKTSTNYWEPLINAIAKVESGGNPKAFNKNGNCAGYLQITPVVVKDCNQILKRKKVNKKYTLKDRFDKQKSIEMFVIYQNAHNPSGNIEKAIRIWNGGPNYSVKATNKYYKKVMKHYKGG